MRFSKYRNYYVCSVCGASLDPGEKCDCSKKEAEKLDNYHINTAGDPARTYTNIHHGHSQQIVV